MCSSDLPRGILSTSPIRGVPFFLLKPPGVQDIPLVDAVTHLPASHHQLDPTPAVPQAAPDRWVSFRFVHESFQLAPTHEQVLNPAKNDKGAAKGKQGCSIVSKCPPPWRVPGPAEASHIQS